MDLVALNVQRGRDHGLPPYLEWRKICGLPRITSWQELAAVVEKPNVSMYAPVITDITYKYIILLYCNCTYNIMIRFRSSYPETFFW